MSTALAVVASVVGLAGTASATPRARPAASATHRSVQAAPRIPAGATKLSSLSPAARLRVDVILRPADPGGLASYAQAVSTPGSPEFHDYLSTTAFASSFGPSPTALATVEAALRGDGLPSGHLSADHLSIRLKASAARLSRAFSTGFVRYRLRSGRTAFANTKAPMLPSAAALDVNGVVGLDDLTLEQAGAVRVATPRRHRSGAAVAPRIQTGGPQPCGAAVAGNAAGSYTADQVAAAYGFPSMYRQGDLGQGQTVAVIEGEPDLATDIAAYQSCYGTDTDVSYVAVDGGAGTGPGSGEAALDIEQIIGLAPEAHVVVYQSSPSATSIYDDLSQAVSDDTARVVSTSWGVCEAAATRLPDPTGGLGAAFGAVFQAENTLFEEAAVQGQSIVAASGDNGSEDCNTFRELGSGYASELSVDDPAGQPFVTGVGGTTLADPGAPSSETVWNSVGSGGGGISELWPMPGYQSGAPASLGVVNADSSGAPCGALSGDCREVPDVSADADPYTGYAIVWNGGWWSVGGTSAGAPLWSALLSLVDASSACAGSPVGFADPALYEAAGHVPGAFNDITTGNDDYTKSNGGLYPALPGYYLATGLGTPTANLPPALCAAATPGPVGFTSVASALFTLGAPGSFTVRASGSPAPAITESGPLPDGVTFSADPDGTATLSGTPVQGGVFPLTMTASDGASSATQTFTLQVGTAPAISSPSTASFSTGVAGSFQVVATGSPTPSISLVNGTLPAGLALSSTGKLVGTPAATSSGTYPITVQASDGIAPPASQAVTVVVDGPPTLTSGATAGFAVGAHASFAITTRAAPAATVTESGALVPGLSFTATGGGDAVIAGTPLSAADFSVTIRATNAYGSTVQTLVIEIGARAQAPAFTSPASDQFVVAVWRTFQFTTTGQPAPTFSIASGSLPTELTTSGLVTELTLSPTGLLSGWPGWSSAGVYRFVVEADNGVGAPAFQDFTLTVAEGGEVGISGGSGVSSALGPIPGLSESTAQAVLGQPFDLAVQGSGLPTPRFTTTGTLPPGTTFTDNGNGTATVAGTPTSGGTFYFYVGASNVVGGGAILVALSVAPAVAPSFASASTLVMPPASPGSYPCVTVTASGFPAPDLTTLGALPPAWFALTSDDGYLLVCNTGAPGSARQTVLATSSAGQATQTLTVDPGTASPPPFSGPTSAVFTAGVYHAVYLGTTEDCGYGPPYPETLPQGITLSSNGLLSGVVSAGWGGSFALAIACKSYAPKYSAGETFTLTVPGTGRQPALPAPPSETPPPEVPPPAPNGTFTITPTLLPLGQAGSAYAATLHATAVLVAEEVGTLKWYVIGRLPPGLKIERTVGVIQGKLRSGDGGVYTFTVQVRGKSKIISNRPPVTVTGEATITLSVVPSARSAGAVPVGTPSARPR